MADSRALPLIATLAAAGVLLGAGLGAIDLWAPDEARYAQVAEELRSFEHGPRGLFLLHLGGEPYTQKPPLYYWLAAAFGAPAGRVTEVAARLPSVLAGVACVALTFAFARQLLPASRAAPWLAGMLLLTSFRFAHQARRAQLDVLLTLFETGALYAFWRLETETREDARRRWIALLHAALGAAALTKGPVGWLPLAIAAVYLLWRGRARDLRALFPLWGLALSVGPALVWITAATAMAPEGFFQAAVLDNLAGRFVSAASHVRPFYYFAYQLPLDFLPWTLLWPLPLAIALRTRREATGLPPAWAFLLCWVGVPLAFFSLASGKRGLYLLPAFPALALLLAVAVDAATREARALPRWLPLVLGLAAAGLAAAAGWVHLQGGIAWQPRPGFGVSAEAAGQVATVAATGGVAGLLLHRTRPANGSIAVAIVATLAIELIVFTRIYPEQDVEKSPRTVARQVAAWTGIDESVGLFDDQALSGGILYYGRRRPVGLEEPGEARSFLDAPGRLVIVEKRKLPWIGEAWNEDPEALRVRGTSRQGSRALVVVESAPAPQTGP